MTSPDTNSDLHPHSTENGQFIAVVKTAPEIELAVHTLAEFDENGRDERGFTIAGIHANGTDWGYDGFDQYGFDKVTGAEYNSFGWDRNNLNEVTGTTFDVDGWSEFGKNEVTDTSFDVDGYTRGGWDGELHKDTGTVYDPNGFTVIGYDKDKFDADGISVWGFTRAGVHEVTGLDRDVTGYDAQGLDVHGHHRFYQPDLDS